MGAGVATSTGAPLKNGALRDSNGDSGPFERRRTGSSLRPFRLRPEVETLLACLASTTCLPVPSYSWTLFCKYDNAREARTKNWTSVFA